MKTNVNNKCAEFVKREVPLFCFYRYLKSSMLYVFFSFTLTLSKRNLVNLEEIKKQFREGWSLAHSCLLGLLYAWEIDYRSSMVTVRSWRSCRNVNSLMYSDAQILKEGTLKGFHLGLLSSHWALEERTVCFCVFFPSFFHHQCLDHTYRAYLYRTPDLLDQSIENLQSLQLHHVQL